MPKNAGKASTALWDAQSMKHYSETKKAEKIIQLDVTNKPLIPPNITRFKRVSVPGNILSLLEQNVL